MAIGVLIGLLFVLIGLIGLAAAPGQQKFGMIGMLIFAALSPFLYGAFGFVIGAVGALESVLTVLTLRDGVIPPTLNYETPDPEIDLDVVAGEPRYGEFRYAINNSFGFGGHNVALAFGRY